MLCNNCNSVINEGDIFCRVCGSKLDVIAGKEDNSEMEEHQKKLSSDTDKHTVNEFEDCYEVLLNEEILADKNTHVDEDKMKDDCNIKYDENAESSIEQKKTLQKVRTRRNNYIVMILFTVICLSFILVYFGKTISTNNKEILFYSRYPIINNGYIYYYENGTSRSQCTFYKEKKDGSSKSSWTTNYVIKADYYSGYIYYVDNTSRLYKVKPDGTGKVKLSNASISNFKIYKNIIYYSTGSSVCRMNTDGTNYKCMYTDLNFSNHINSITIIYDRIYIVSIDKIPNIWSIDMNGKNIKKIYSFKDSSIYPIEIKGKYLYYMSYKFNSNNTAIQNMQIWKLSLVGKEEKKVLLDSAYYMGISGNWMYYRNSADNNKLYKIGLDGKNNKKISDKFISSGDIIDSTIYFKDNNNDLCSMKLDGTGFRKL